MFSVKRRQFEKLYRRQSRRIFRLAANLTGFDHHDAQDVTQEVFIRAFESFEKYRDTGLEYAWLRTICVNIVREKYRRYRFFQDKIEPEIQNERKISTGVSNPLTDMLNMEMTDRVMEMIKILKVEFKEVLVMRHLEGLSTAETAKALNVPEGTVRSRLKRARDMLVAGCTEMENLP